MLICIHRLLYYFSSCIRNYRDIDYFNVYYELILLKFFCEFFVFRHYVNRLILGHP